MSDIDEREDFDLTKVYGKPRLGERIAYAVIDLGIGSIVIFGSVISWAIDAIDRIYLGLAEGRGFGKFFRGLAVVLGLAVSATIIFAPVNLLSWLSKTVSWISESIMSLIFGSIEVPEGAVRWQNAQPTEPPVNAQGWAVFGSLIAVSVIGWAVTMIVRNHRAKERELKDAVAEVMAKHDDLLDQWRRYTHDDIDLVERYEFLSDVEEPLIAEHLDALDCARMARPTGAVAVEKMVEYRNVVDAVEILWQNALDEATAITESKTGGQDRRLLREAGRVWDDVSNIEATPRQRARSARKMRRLMERLDHRVTLR